MDSVGYKNVGHGLEKMNVEFYLRTFSFLEPQDLLSISRTSKSLRYTVLKKSFETVWRVARLNLNPPLPELPSDMSEPEYASLAFDSDCHVCAAPHCQKDVIWSCRIRCCPECLDTCFIWDFHVSRTYRSKFSKALDELGIAVLQEIIPGCILVDDDGRAKWHLYREILEDYLAEFTLVMNDLTDQEKWLDEKRANLGILNTHDRLCEEWNTHRVRVYKKESRDMPIELAPSLSSSIERRRSSLRTIQKASVLPGGVLVVPDKNNKPAQRSAKTAKTETKSIDASKLATKIKKSDVLGSVGSLEGIPLDVIAEMFSFLKPLDLLNISRTSRALRSVVLRKKFAPVWKAARNRFNPRLPELPDDLSEVQYASLAFETYCQGCDSERTKNITYWSCRVRCCSKCLNFCFISWDCHARVTYRSQYPKALRELGVSDLNEIVPTRSWLDKSARPHKPKSAFPRTILEKYLAEFTALPDNTIARESWFEGKKGDLKARIEHEKLMASWDDRRDICERDELALAEKKRVAAEQRRAAEIFRRLQQDGWEDEWDLFSDRAKLELESHNLVKGSATITDHAWKTIKNDIHSFMKQQQQLRSSTFRRKRIIIRWRIVSLVQKMFTEEQGHTLTGIIIPSCADFIQFPPIATIVEETPKEKPLTLSMFDAVIAQLPELCLEWRASVEKKLLQFIQDSSRYSKSKTKPRVASLRLATTLFSCNLCKKTISYPQILSHPCCNDKHNPSKYHPRHDPDAVISNVGHHVGSTPWSTDCLAYQTLDIWKLKLLVDMCGLDPDTATPDEMQSLDPLFILRSKSKFSVEVMGWEYALRRVLLDSEKSQLERWEVLLTNRSDDNIRQFSCIQCTKEGFSSIHKFKLHLQQHHSFDQASRSGSGMHHMAYPPCKALIKIEGDN